MAFGDWLRRELELRNLTMGEFGKRVGVSQATVSRWISGERRPDRQSPNRIALALGIDPDVVYEQVGHPVSVRGSQISAFEELMRLKQRRDSLKEDVQRLQSQLDELERVIASQEAELERLEQRELLRQVFFGDVTEREFWQDRLWRSLPQPLPEAVINKILELAPVDRSESPNEAFLRGVLAAAEALQQASGNEFEGVGDDSRPRRGQTDSEEHGK